MPILPKQDAVGPVVQVVRLPGSISINASLHSLLFAIFTSKRLRLKTLMGNIGKFFFATNKFLYYIDTRAITFILSRVSVFLERTVCTSVSHPDSSPTDAFRRQNRYFLTTHLPAPNLTFCTSSITLTSHSVLLLPELYVSVHGCLGFLHIIHTHLFTQRARQTCHILSVTPWVVIGISRWVFIEK